jgi:hypothetical protein
VFRPVNLHGEYPGALGKYDQFDRSAACEEADRLRRRVLWRYDVVLVCGKATAWCFGLEPLQVTGLGRRTTVYALPHPAGTSMWWNDPANREAGALVAREAWLHALESQRGKESAA